jgi:poly [ADP-ribose] polymerase 2/3/4
LLQESKPPKPLAPVSNFGNARNPIKPVYEQMSVKAYRVGSSDEPAFASDFEVLKKAVLQLTDLTNNNNKYYAIELHQAIDPPAGSQAFRVFTHYGRTDDLETNPNAGAKETRYFDELPVAEVNYGKIYREKSSPSKGYKEVSLASSKIGSHKARGTSSGEVDAKTLERIEGEKEKRAARPPSQLTAGVQNLVRYIYDEATNALTNTVAAKITANGIETPLGVLTLGQIERGEMILQQLYGAFQNKEAKNFASQTEDLSGEFYTCIPHRIGRTREAIQSSIINSLEQFEQKQETLQLMKDMLQVNGDSGNVLFFDEIDAKFDALKCQIHALSANDGDFQRVADYVVKSQIKSKSIKVKNVFTLKRPHEWDAFNNAIDNQRELFHGSRIKNWVGLLSRGILMPKIVVSMGVNRTDAGWLGNGIYFGDASCTASFYTTAGKQGTRFMAVARVALGKMAPYKKITYGIEKPPEGFDSCHGVRHKLLSPSQFADDEYVIYNQNQQRLEYLVEFTA